MLENKYQALLIIKLRKMFEGCIILKNDSSYIQGFPDITILYNEFWAVLEVKKSEDEPYRPNQEYYLSYLDDMFFARTVYPENESEVLSELQQAFQTRRKARLPRSK